MHESQVLKKILKRYVNVSWICLISKPKIELLTDKKTLGTVNLCNFPFRERKYRWTKNVWRDSKKGCAIFISFLFFTNYL